MASVRGRGAPLHRFAVGERPKGHPTVSFALARKRVVNGFASAAGENKEKSPEFSVMHLLRRLATAVTGHEKTAWIAGVGQHIAALGAANTMRGNVPRKRPRTPSSRATRKKVGTLERTGAG